MFVKFGNKIKYLKIKMKKNIKRKIILKGKIIRKTKNVERKEMKKKVEKNCMHNQNNLSRKVLELSQNQNGSSFNRPGFCT